MIWEHAAIGSKAILLNLKPAFYKRGRKNKKKLQYNSVHSKKYI